MATQSQTILKYLRDNPGYIPAFKLQQIELNGKWIGSAGSRRCRELAEEGLIERKLQGRYVFYRAVQPKEIIEYRDSLTGKLVRRESVYD